VRADRANPNYAAAVATAKRDAERVVVLARSSTGIPVTGAVTLLRNDPLTQGPKLFAKNCASCHRYDGHDGLGGQPKDELSASDLKGFASRAWLAGLLDPARIDSPHYFGGSKHKEVRYFDIHEGDELDETHMTRWIKQAAALPGWQP
jgi:ubiquinol-cytochrome c reductase cytochrome b subunit